MGEMRRRLISRRVQSCLLSYHGQTVLLSYTLVNEMSDLEVSIWVSAGFTLVGLVAGGIIAYVYYRKSLRDKELAWTSWMSTLVAPYSTKNPHLKILYDDQVVETVGISWVMIWNNGKGAIRLANISRTEPLIIDTSKQSLVLDAKLVAITDPACQVHIAIDPSRENILVTLDFLNPRQGFVVQVTHLVPVLASIWVEGVLIDMPPPHYVVVPSRKMRALPKSARSDVRDPRWADVFWSVVLYLGLMTVTIVMLAVAWLIGADASIFSVLIFFGMFYILIVAGGGAFIQDRRTYQLPLNLDRFHDDGESSDDYWGR